MFYFLLSLYNDFLQLNRVYCKFKINISFKEFVLEANEDAFLQVTIHKIL